MPVNLDNACKLALISLTTIPRCPTAFSIKILLKTIYFITMINKKVIQAAKSSRQSSSGAIQILDLKTAVIIEL